MTFPATECRRYEIQWCQTANLRRCKLPDPTHQIDHSLCVPILKAMRIHAFHRRKAQHIHRSIQHNNADVDQRATTPQFLIGKDTPAGNAAATQGAGGGNVNLLKRRWSPVHAAVAYRAQNDGESRWPAPAQFAARGIAYRACSGVTAAVFRTSHGSPLPVPSGIPVMKTVSEQTLTTSGFTASSMACDRPTRMRISFFCQRLRLERRIVTDSHHSRMLRQ